MHCLLLIILKMDSVGKHMKQRVYTLLRSSVIWRYEYDDDDYLMHDGYWYLHTMPLMIHIMMLDVCLLMHVYIYICVFFVIFRHPLPALYLLASFHWLLMINMCKFNETVIIFQSIQWMLLWNELWCCAKLSSKKSKYTCSRRKLESNYNKQWLLIVIRHESQDSTGKRLWITTFVVYTSCIRIQITHISNSRGVGVCVLECCFFGKAVFGIQ